MSQNEPPFINSPDMQQGLPPFFFEELEIRTFYLKADPSRLAAWCDTFLNVSDNYRFRPLLPLVVLGINSYPVMRTLHPGMSQLGFTNQNEYYLMFPVLMLERILGLWLPRSVSWAYPYIGVDNASSAFTGQEVLGFRKMLGNISFETDTATGKFKSTVAMPGFAALGQNQAQEMLPVLRVETGAPLANPGTAALAGPWAGLALNEMEGLVETAVLHLLEAFDPGLFTVINLKQFRDGFRPEKAVYQSLVRCSFRQIGTQPPTVYDGATISIVDNVTISAAATLGIGANPTPLLVTGYKTDMWFGDIETLWAAN